ncbi:glutathione S-transferase 2-like [Anopheles aquasalis]|uniref:glutathione S-transferase 2-like n=1 Tax=Anopheles aquasalis TaxID=42839 RepID=UPI00215A824F|nr:glutathione S-transferase 2-like [Anopheles aquasalis]
MLELYYLPGSAPCRAVQMTAAAVGLTNLNLKYLNLMAGEHRKPEYVKLNPQRSIPTLVDGDTVLTESRAILMYLCDRYGAKADARDTEDSERCSWYPRDVLQRAAVNQRLFFDACVLYPRFTDLYHPVVFGGAAPDPKKITAFEGAVALLDTFLTQSAFVAGSHMTIADISLFATLATACALQFQLSPFANVHRWYGAMLEQCPGASLNIVGAKDFCSYK